ncbi:cellulose synthase subunit BcsC-related outer membrane protein [Vibrio sp. YIC-376]|uniref:cellulose synthase subunit BcsC-related outer membrane protein n=1 Tax=Vibrio sp. YIC-376 TaxID=3136162 RepID=UPI00402ACE97
MSLIERSPWVFLFGMVMSEVEYINTVQAQDFYSAPLSRSQLDTVYRPVEAVQFSTSGVRVDSVEWLISQLRLADVVGRDDIVESTLERLFAIDENSPDGLFYLANMYLKRQQFELAQQTLERLTLLAPDSPQVRSLSLIIAIQSTKSFAYQQAKLFAKAGRYQEAIQAYQSIFPFGMPTAALQLEFLELQSDAGGLWNQVKQGLERLNAEYPGVPQFQLALANHIRKDNPTEPWVLATYRALALNPRVGTSAAASWVRALEQLPISQEVVQEYAILASYYPSDIKIQSAHNHAKARWSTEQELRKDPTYLAKLKGLQLVELGRTKQAEAQLRYALTTRPQDHELLGAMGKVYLRQGQQKKALYYFQQAQKLDTDLDNASKWRSLVQVSQYWAYLKNGDQLADKGQWQQAEKYYRKAIAVDKTQPDAFVYLGALYLQQKDYLAAERAYLQALTLEPKNRLALRGRLIVRTAQQDWAGAKALAHTYSPVQKSAVAEEIKNIDSEIALSRLRVAIAQDDDNTMKQAIEELIALDVRSPWLRLDIADVVRSLGDKPRADRLMRDWVQFEHDAEMKFAYALYLAQGLEVEKAIAELESVPPDELTSAMQTNLVRLKLDSALENIQKRYPESPQSVTAQLHSLETQYSKQIQALSRLAGIWIDSSNIAEAERIYEAMEPSSSWSAPDILAYGGLMVDLNKFDEFKCWLKTFSTTHNIQELDASFLVQFDHLDTRRMLGEADYMVNNQRYSEAMDLYSRVASEPEPFQSQAQIGLLQTSVLTKDNAAYQDARQVLKNKQDTLTATQLLTAAMVFHQQGDHLDADEFNQLLEKKTDVDGFTYRESMKLAMENQHWTLAEVRAYQVLNYDRIEKSTDPKEALKSSTSLRELYETADDYWLTRNVKADLDTLHDRNDGHVIIGWDDSARDGKNTSRQIPIEARIPVEPWNGHLLLRADYVSVDSGKLDYYEKETDSGGTKFRSKASGIALGVGWQAKEWQADIGTTPVGLDHTTWVGGVNITGELGDFGWRVDASRRPLTSSTLAYAGMSVPSGGSDVDGTKWGGVVSSGVKLNSSWDVGGPYGFWNSLQYHVITGKNVEDNTRLGALAGAYYKLMATDQQRLSIGANVMYLTYDKNLSEYTLGHGGYYSPQRYFSVSLPVNYYGRYNNTWSYQLSASISNSWTEDDAPYFSIGGASSTGGGFGTSFQAAVEKRVSKRWYLGGVIDLQHSEFYKPNHFMLYAKYTFNDRWQPIESLPAAATLYSDF